MNTRPFQLFDTRVLDVEKFTQAKLIDPSFFQGQITYEEMAAHECHAMLHMITVRCATKKIDRKEITVPANWWEAVKERFVPTWLLKRFPVKVRKFVMEASAYYPEIAIPGHQAFVHCSCIEVSKQEDTNP